MKKLTLILSIMIALVGLNANAAIYIVGDGPLGGWSFNGGNEMFDSGNGVYVHEMTIPEDAESAIVYFVFADGRGADWTEFNNTMRIGPTAGNIKIEDANWIETQKAGGDNGAYYFAGIKGESYTVTYDSTNSKFKVDGAFEQPVQIPSTRVSRMTGMSRLFFMQFSFYLFVSVCINNKNDIFIFEKFLTKSG
jgi:hypothetical protein